MAEIIVLAGGAGCGKTTLAALMAKRFGAVVVSLDRWYRGLRHKQAAADRGEPYEWVDPRAMDLEGCAAALEKLAAGEPAEVPVYDMRVSEPVSVETVGPAPMVVLEGVLALHVAVPFSAWKFYILLSDEERLARRIRRDVHEGRRKSEAEVRAYAPTSDLQHRRHVLPTRSIPSVIDLDGMMAPEDMLREVDHLISAADR